MIKIYIKEKEANMKFVNIKGKPGKVKDKNIY
jgi:hypothetical protein